MSASGAYRFDDRDREGSGGPAFTAAWPANEMGSAEGAAES